MKIFAQAVLVSLFAVGLSGVSCSLGRGEAVVKSNFETGTPVPANSASMSGDQTLACKKDDIDCFIAAARQCRKATYTLELSVDLGPSVITKVDAYEIKGGSVDACEVYFKVLKWEGKRNEEYFREMARRGQEPFKSDPELAKAADERMAKFVGTDGNCTFPGERLAKTFERWRDQSFSSNDFKDAKCKGTFFTPENGYPEGF